MKNDNLNNYFNQNLLMQNNNPQMNELNQQLNLIKMLTMLKGNNNNFLGNMGLEGNMGNMNNMGSMGNMSNMNSMNFLTGNNMYPNYYPYNSYMNQNMNQTIPANTNHSKVPVVAREITNNFNIVNDNVFTARNNEDFMNLIKSLDPSKK